MPGAFSFNDTVGAVRHEIVTDVLHGAACQDYADGIAGRAAAEFFMPGFSCQEFP